MESALCYHVYDNYYITHFKFISLNFQYLIIDYEILNIDLSFSLHDFWNKRGGGENVKTLRKNAERQRRCNVGGQQTIENVSPKLYTILMFSWKEEKIQQKKGTSNIKKNIGFPVD